MEKLNTSYDYNSLLHFSEKAFSVLGNSDTIFPHLNITIGQRDGFSPTDVQKINKYYSCPDGMKHNILLVHFTDLNITSGLYDLSNFEGIIFTWAILENLYSTVNPRI